jgi:hypothetical protein
MAKETAAEKKARQAAAAANAGLDVEDTETGMIEEGSDDDGETGLVPDTNDIPELQKPAELIDYDFKRAVELGLPKMPKKYTQKYLDLYTVYVRFIKQNPWKWDVNTDNGKSLLRDLEALDITKRG